MDLSKNVKDVKTSEDHSEDDVSQEEAKDEKDDLGPQSAKYEAGRFCGRPKTHEGQSAVLVASSSSSQSAVGDIEDQARCLFVSGIQAEKLGHLEEAISFYRRAVQLVPDIEFRIADYSDDSIDEISDDESLPIKSMSHFEDIEYDNLVQKFQIIATVSGHNCICQPKHPRKGSHISILPPEIFIFILKWVVSSDLDLISLEQVSKVCRGFYLCARDPEIWRLACMRVWGGNVETPNRYGSWREMFIQRPHLSFNGAYISRTTYIRYGEPSFQDANYRPCYLVEYYRYLRFFPEGFVLMLTTPDDPYQSLAKLRHRKIKYQNVLCGHYKLVGSAVLAVLKKAKSETAMPSTLNSYYRYRWQRALNQQEAFEQIFHLDLELRTIKNRYNCQLVWNRYSISTVHRNGQETVSDFELTPSNFPPFWFSRVRSFSSESEYPLK